MRRRGQKVNPTETLGTAEETFQTAEETWNPLGTALEFYLYKD